MNLYVLPLPIGEDLIADGVDCLPQAHFSIGRASPDPASSSHFPPLADC